MQYVGMTNTFHYRYISTVLGITKHQQWELRITSVMTRDWWDDSETITTKRRLEWLGHVARTTGRRMPKMDLFGWLPQTRLPGGPCMMQESDSYVHS